MSVKTPGASTPKVYIGSTETSFKQRHVNHMTSIRHEKYENSTELSKYTWQLKRSGQAFAIDWEICEKASAYSAISKRCNLCIAEKLWIACAEKGSLLNKRTELVSKCWHENKFSLVYFSPVT